MSAAQAKIWFERLAVLLPFQKLPAEYGPARFAKPEEFMFMQEYQGVGQFKHSDTRNYLMVTKARPVNSLSRPSPNGYELLIPINGDAFNLGFFDVFSKNGTADTRLTDMIADVEKRHFRTEHDTGANPNVLMIWNIVREYAGLPLLERDDLPKGCTACKSYHAKGEECPKANT